MPDEGGQLPSRAGRRASGGTGTPASRASRPSAWWGRKASPTRYPAIMEAWGERSPVIFITGSSTLKRQGAGGFKEIDDVAIAGPLTKYSASITDGTRIGEFVDRAWKIATSGYPGPVHLSLPVDIMFSSVDEDAGRAERPFCPRQPAGSAGIARSARSGPVDEAACRRAPPDPHRRAWRAVVRQ